MSKKTGKMTLSTARRRDVNEGGIDEAKAEAFAAGAETERQKAAPGPPQAKGALTIRDTFSMPQTDYDLIDSIKVRCMREGVGMNKSEILRAGLILLDKASTSDLVKAVSQVEKVRPGRRKNPQ